MVAARITLPNQAAAGPRPMNLARDVAQILSLLNLVFKPAMDATSQQLLGNSLTLNAQPGVLFRLNHLTTGMSPGFVWESEGRIIGTTSLMKANHPGRYLIANVAVHPGYRRRGIARALMRACLAEVQRRQGREILLQVEHDNDGAIELYRQLGFATVGNMTHWYASSSTVRELAAPAADRGIRPVRASEAGAALALDVAALNPDLSWPEPPARRDYESGLWARLRNMVNARQQEIWVLEDEQGALQGVAAIVGDFGQAYRLTVRVPPGGREHYQRPLLAKLVRRLRYLSQRTISLDHPADDETMNDMLRQANFKARRTLTTMKHTV